jgi:hypothetical protein
VITLSSDKNPVSDENDYYEDETAMLYMALLYAGLSNSDLRIYIDRVARHVEALAKEPDNPSAGEEYMQENGKRLAGHGIKIENKKQNFKPSHFPIIITTIYNGFHTANVIARIERILPDGDKYIDNSYGYGC